MSLTVVDEAGGTIRPDLFTGEKHPSRPVDQIRYAHVTGDYWHAEFDGLKLTFNEKTFVFNATQLCELGGKRFYDWLQTKESRKRLELVRDFMEEYCPEVPQPMMETITEPYDAVVRGTYFPLETFLHVARWVSRDVEKKASDIVWSVFHEANRREKLRGVYFGDGRLTIKYFDLKEAVERALKYERSRIAEQSERVRWTRIGQRLSKKSDEC